MKKKVYLIECKELVFLRPDQPIKKMLVDAYQLSEMLTQNFEIYNARLVDLSKENILNNKEIISLLK